MKKGIIVVLVMSFLIVCCSCNANENESLEDNKAPVAVSFERIIDNDSSKEYAVIEGRDSDDEVVWTYTTQKYIQAEMERVQEIGRYKEQYYLLEGGKIIALDTESGEVLWINGDFSGALLGSEAAYIDEEGTIYLCGYHNPDFFVLSSEGETLNRIDRFNEQYYWAAEIFPIDSSTMAVAMENGPEGYKEEDKYLFYVDKETYHFWNADIETETKILSSEQLESVKRSLGVPKDLEVEIKQDEAYYWKTGERWVIYIAILYQGSTVATASVDADTGELVKDIYNYCGDN